MSYVNHENGLNGKMGQMGAVNADMALQKEAFVKLLTKFIRYERCSIPESVQVGKIRRC